MTISSKHTVETIDGRRCVVIEKDAGIERMNFLRELLTFNGYTVCTQLNVPPAPKVAKPVATEGSVETTQVSTPAPLAAPALPETYKVGVTDLSFVVSVMVYTRKLRTLDGRVLLPTYWTQEQPSYNDWYWLSRQS